MTNPPEEWRFLPQGFLHPAGAGDRVCLHCKYFHYHPTVLCLPICACHLHQGLVENQRESWCAALIGRQGTVQTSKKGCRSTPEFWFGSVNPLIRYKDVTPQSSSSDPPTGMRRIAFLPSLISNSAPGSSSSMAVYALPTRRLPLPCTFAV